MFRDSPVFGVGFGTFDHLSIYYMADLGLQKKLVAHNMYVQFFAELGILGIVTFLSILFLSFRGGLRLRKKKPDQFSRGMAVAFLATVVSLAVANAFGNRFFNGTLTGYFWIFSALIFNAQALMKKEDNAVEGEGRDRKVPVRVRRRLEAEKRRKKRRKGNQR
jgi:putative inorganic carbon (HCO3(-)) transporter